MTRIFGIYCRDNKPVQDRVLMQMSEILEHRGTDRSGLWFRQSVGLGHQMLCSTPESLAEKQPWIAESEKYVITADARLDNREELFSLLNLDLQSAATISDSQLILQSYLKWKTNCLQYLLGDFAFAIWDEREQQLFCARDCFGVKPFYYYLAPKTFAFATEIKALFCLSEIPRRLNEYKVADYLMSVFEDKANTFYRDILRLPPAHYLTVNSDKINLARYWSLDVEPELKLESNLAYSEAFQEHFSAAVNCRLRSAFPVGSFLSGGLDSSSISCMANQLLAERNKIPLHTFSAIFDTVTQCDERSYIESVTVRDRIKSHYIKADQISPLSDLERVFWHQDEAFFAPNLFMHSAIYQAAAQQGVRVILDGFDGDTVVSHGITYMTELARHGKWLALIKEVRGFTRNFDRDFSRMLWQYIWQYGLSPQIPQSWQKKGQKLTRRYRRPLSPALQIDLKFAQRLALQDRLLQLQPYRNNPPLTEREAHYRRLSWGVIPFSLEVVDRSACVFGIEPRYPFFDRRLVEFCLSVPPQQKISGGWTRNIMRRGMEGILPTKIQWRGGKSDLSPNFHHVLRTFELERCRQIVEEDLELLEPYIDVTVLQKTWERFAAGETMPDSDVLAIWKPITLALWLKYSQLSP